MSAREPEPGSFALLRTKLHRPHVASDVVHRPRLLDQLDKGPDKKLTLVSAPAGSGKTTLLVDWLDACESPGAWLSLDENDNDAVGDGTPQLRRDPRMDRQDQYCGARVMSKMGSRSATG